MKNVFIIIKVDSDVDYSLELFTKKVQNILNSKKGWKLKGYKFFFVSPLIFEKLSKHNTKIILRLSKNKTISKECEFDINEKLSCYNPTINPPNININFYRWINGSKASKLNIKDYRVYVINHEIGHALGRGHITDCINKDDPAPIMMQQTVSIGKCSPNIWPLDDE